MTKNGRDPGAASGPGPPSRPVCEHPWRSEHFLRDEIPGAFPCRGRTGRLRRPPAWDSFPARDAFMRCHGGAFVEDAGPRTRAAAAFSATSIRRRACPGAICFSLLLPNSAFDKAPRVERTRTIRACSLTFRARRASIFLLCGRASCAATRFVLPLWRAFQHLAQPGVLPRQGIGFPAQRPDRAALARIDAGLRKGTSP